MAAIAAGADAIYCGLQHFSARMMAKNFTLAELAGLTELAHSRSIKASYCSWLRRQNLGGDEAGCACLPLNSRSWSIRFPSTGKGPPRN